MNNTWDMLAKELEIYGIRVIDNKYCTFKENGKIKKFSFLAKILNLKEKHAKNCKIIKQIFYEITKLSRTDGTIKAIDHKILNIFIGSVNDLLNFIKLLECMSENFEKFNKNYRISGFVRKILDEDYKNISYNFMNNFSNHKIALDWIYRKNSQIEYVASLLRLLMIGKSKVNSVIIKEARGVQGPWSNLDLPMGERIFSWDEVSGETYGREKDKRNQQRYRAGLDTYHNSGRVGEGYYWREMRNEPFSWSNRFTDSPYPQLRPGTWR